MKIYIERIKPNETLFFAAYFIFLIFGILSQSFYYRYMMSVYKPIILICCVILFINELQYLRTTDRGFYGLLICLFLFLVTFFASNGANQNTVPALFLFVYSARNIDFEKIAKYTVFLSSLLLILIVASAYLGIINDYTFVTYAEDKMRVRHYIGFRYALYPSTIAFNITCLVLYLKKEQIKLWHVLALVAVNYWIYAETDSRLTFALSLLICGVGYLMKFCSAFMMSRRRLLWVGSFGYILFFALALYFTIKFNPGVSWMNTMDVFLGNRLKLGQASIATYGIGLLPNTAVEWVGAGLDAYGNRSTLQYTYVDSLYIQVLQHYGIIFTALFLVLMTMLMLKIRNSDIYLYVIMFAIAAHFVIDDLQWYLHYNTFWFSLGAALIGAVTEISERQKSETDGESPATEP